MNRRELLQAAIAGGALSLAGTLGCGGNQRAQRIRRADQTGELAANMYVTVMPDGRVALAINKAEIGQGVATGYAALVAEELEVPLAHVDFYFADSFPRFRTSFFMHQTGGSTSTKEAYLPLRRAAASARQMLIAAAAAGWGVPAETCHAEAGRVIHAASARTAGYGALTIAAGRREVPDDVPLKRAGDFRVVGTRLQRVDARAKVTGKAEFGLDVVVPDMVRAVMIHGPVFGAEPRAVRADAARRRPGIVDIFAVRWGVAVVADKHWQTLAAAREVEVDWGPGLVEDLDTDALRAAMRDHQGAGTSARKVGDVGGALAARGATRVEAFYEAPFLAHAPMEPQNCTVRLTRGKAEVWVPCQAPTVIQAFVADAVGLERDDVLVHTTYAGGGFGRRVVGDYAAQAAVIARKVGRPVQLLWTRASDTTQGYYRPQTAAMLRGAVRDGKATALGAHVLGQSIVLESKDAAAAVLPGWLPRHVKDVMVDAGLAMFGTGTLPDMFATEGLADTPYQFANLAVAFSPVRTGMPVTSWRSVGHSFNGFAIESFVDELAAAAGQDPLAMRQAMLPADSRPRRVLDAVARLAGWGTPLPPGVGRGLARHSSFGSEVAEVAEVEIVRGRIRVRKVHAVIDCGLAVNPDGVRAQVEGAIIFGLSAALDQQITLVDGAVQQANFDSFPTLRMHECPEIVVEIMSSTEAPTGAGEPGLPPIAPAVANAIFAATGVRLRRMPLQRAWAEREGGA